MFQQCTESLAETIPQTTLNSEKLSRNWKKLPVSRLKVHPKKHQKSNLTALNRKEKTAKIAIKKLADLFKKLQRPKSKRKQMLLQWLKVKKTALPKVYWMLLENKFRVKKLPNSLKSLKNKPVKKAQRPLSKLNQLLKKRLTKLLKRNLSLQPKTARRR